MRGSRIDTNRHEIYTQSTKDGGDARSVAERVETVAAKCRPGQRLRGGGGETILADRTFSHIFGNRSGRPCHAAACPPLPAFAPRHALSKSHDAPATTLGLCTAIVGQNPPLFANFRVRRADAPPAFAGRQPAVS